MSTWRNLVAAAALGAIASAALAQAPAADRYRGIGRAATPAEVAAWDIDVRADFKGLPKGSGSVAKGQDIWEGKCATCHGIFGESNQVFTPLIGGTTAEDIRTGRVANLKREDYPGRTTMMKAPYVSTLWDYINRAMPWNAPKSLSVEEVYAVTAFMLNLAGVVPDNFVLSDANIAEVQKRMPNRNGLTTAHAMWPGSEFGGTKKPDAAGVACMTNCSGEVKIESRLPDHARNAHGNLAQQNRLVGPQRGAQTTAGAAAVPLVASAPVVASAPAVAPTAAPGVAAAPAARPEAKRPADLLQKNNCIACHADANRLVGPSWREVATRHAGKAEYLAGKIRSGGQGVWGPIPMPPQGIDAKDAARIAEWLAGGAKP